MVLMGQPEIYFQYQEELFGPEGQVTDARTAAFLDRWVERFTGWIARTAEPRTDAQAGEEAEAR